MGRLWASIRNFFRPDPVIAPIDATSFVERCFASHGVLVERKESLLILDNRYGAAADFVNERRYEQSCSVQLDVRFACTPDRIIVESCVGMGKDMQAARASAFESFLRQSFHVLVAAFFGKAADQVDIEQWNINGTPRRVVVGGLCFKGSSPAPQELMVANPKYYQAMVERLKHASLSNDVHWLRMYFAMLPGSPGIAEVLLDNETWTEAQDELANYPWPVASAFYSLRLFLIVLPEAQTNLEAQ